MYGPRRLAHEMSDRTQRVPVAQLSTGSKDSSRTLAYPTS